MKLYRRQHENKIQLAVRILAQWYDRPQLWMSERWIEAGAVMVAVMNARRARYETNSD